MDYSDISTIIDEHLLLAVPQPLPDEQDTDIVAYQPLTAINKSLTSGAPSPWDPRLVMDLALEVDALPDILLRYDLTVDDYHALCGNLAFRRDLSMAIRELKENGLTFQHKARVQAEHYLSIVDDLVNNFDTPASVKLEAIKSTVSWGRLDPKLDKNAEAQANATQINVNINF